MTSYFGAHCNFPSERVCRRLYIYERTQSSVGDQALYKEFIRFFVDFCRTISDPFVVNKKDLGRMHECNFHLH